MDSQKIEDGCMMVNLMWSAPLQVGLAIFFLYQTIGVAVFVGKFTGHILNSDKIAVLILIDTLIKVAPVRSFF